MSHQTRHVGDTDHLSRGNLPGFIQLIRQNLKPVCLGKCLQVRENVKYPVISHLNSRFQWLMKG